MRLASRKCSLLVLFALTVCFTGIASLVHAQISDVPTNFIESYNSGDYTTASGLFHYPLDSTDKEKKQEAEAVGNLLKLFRSEFGKITGYGRAKKKYRFYRAVIGTGDMSYWERYPVSNKMIYEVTFGKLGKGYIVIALVKINRKTEVRHVTFGLPMDNPDAKQTMAAITNRMSSILRR